MALLNSDVAITQEQTAFFSFSHISCIKKMNHTRKTAKKDTIFAFFRLKICVCQKKAVILQSRLKKAVLWIAE